MALRCSGLAALGLACHCAFARTGEQTAEPQRPDAGPPREIRERMERQRAFSERMRNAGSMDERMKIMEEQRAWERKRAVEDLKEQLGVSDQEWTVIRPRVQVVYDLVHPPLRIRPGSAQPTNDVERRRRDLQELLRDEKAQAEKIKARLTALRAAKERATQELSRARQSLRQLMTVRQEAVLVLNGLLD